VFAAAISKLIINKLLVLLLGTRNKQKHILAIIYEALSPGGIKL
jgi:hypothetical protein